MSTARTRFRGPGMTGTVAAMAGACVFSLISIPSHAELIDNGGGLIYDTVLDITWAQPELATPPPAGYRSWDDANDWAAGLTLGGVDGWRLPYASVAVGAGQLVDQPVDCTMASEAECADHELAYMFYYNLSGTLGESILLSGDPDLALFPDLDTTAPYWTGTQRNVDGVPEVGVPDTAWLFNFLNGNWRDSERQREVKATWAVHEGNIAVPTAKQSWGMIKAVYE